MGCRRARHAMERDPLDGSLYVFVNWPGTQVKCLYFDRSGFCIWGKRLEAGRFIGDWRKVFTREIWTGLDWVEAFDRGDGSGCVRKRFSFPSSIEKSL
jgi:hypothetical protein